MAENTKDGKQLLMQAIFNGSLNEVQKIISSGIDLNERRPDGKTYLMETVICSENMADTQEIIKCLIKNGADINAQDPSDGETALFKASWIGNVTTVKTLLDLNVDVFIENNDGNTAFEKTINVYNKYSQETAYERKQMEKLDKVLDLLDAAQKKQFSKNLESAKKGDENAQIKTAKCYLFQRGIEKDDYEMAYWFSEAAKKGNADGLYWLSQCCYYGIGTEKNYKTSEDLLIKAAIKGNKIAEYKLGLIFLDIDVKQAISFLKQSSEQGYADATATLAEIYLKGEKVKIDKDKGQDYLFLAASQGSAYANNLIGRLILDGEISVVNFSTQESNMIAFQNFQTAAEKDYMPAYLNLAECFEKGLGIEKNFYRAMNLYGYVLETSTETELFNAAIFKIKKYKNNYENIENSIVLYYLSQEFTGLGNKLNPKKYIDLLSKSANLGFAKAQYELGKMYESGLHVEKDIDKAIKLFKDAAAQGDEGAIYSLKYIEDN